jgi:hypothetical protein
MLWRRLDVPGHEVARLDGRRLRGTAVFDETSLSYDITCDEAWHTRHATVRGWIGTREIDLTLTAPLLEGCIDLDLNFSPSTNLLPIRRLNLAIGEEAQVRAAWLRYPSMELEPLEQRYRRTGERTYRYESGGGAFTSELLVDADGFVLDYAGLWQAICRPATHA